MKKNSKRGFVYTLEALIVIGSLFFILAYFFRLAPPTLQPDLMIMKKSGMEALEFMDQYYNLSGMVLSADESGLENILSGLLPGNIKFETEICILECRPAGLPKTENVVVIDYYVATHQDEYVGYKVRLWMWI